MVAPSYHRLTRPRRDVVNVAEWEPRRSTTLVFDAPHPMPVGPNTTSSFDTSSATPWSAGPGQDRRAAQPVSAQRSMRSESAAIRTRARVAHITAALRAAPSASDTSAAARSTAMRSRVSLSRGRAIVHVTPITIRTTTSSTSVNPRRTLPIKHEGRFGLASKQRAANRKNAGRGALTESGQIRYVEACDRVAAGARSVH